MNRNQVYLITDIKEYGKFVSYCIDNNIHLNRAFWDERSNLLFCYWIDWENRICVRLSSDYCESHGYEIVTPCFGLNDYGFYNIIPDKSKK